MLKIIDGKLATITAEGAFETTPVDAHRQITELLLEYMQDTNPEHLRENFHNAIRLYDIGKRIYKDNSITEQETMNCLVPLLQELIYDRSERHLAALVMRYVSREYYYKITEKAEPESLDTFFHFVRDNLIFVSLTETLDQELYYRLVDGIFSTSNYDRPNEILRDEVCADLKFIQDDFLAFVDAVLEGKELPTYQPHEYFYITPTLLVAPYMVASWADYSKYEGKWHYSLKNEIDAQNDIFRNLHKETRVFNKGDGKWPYDHNKYFFNRAGSEIRTAYDIAVSVGDYSSQYLIAQLIGSDFMRRKIARLVGCTTKIPKGGRSAVRAIKKILKLAAIGIGVYVGYSILKAIYDFIDIPFIFWFLFIGALGGLGGTETIKTMAVYDHRAYRYMRMKQADETIKAIKNKR